MKLLKYSILLLAVCTTAAGAQQSEKPAGIGYPSVAAALTALKARSDVEVKDHGGWTVVIDPTNQVVWSFTPADHPAYPAAVRRRAIEQDGQVFLDTQALCQAEKSACDKLMAEFDELNNRTIEQSQPAVQGQWTPSKQDQQEVAELLAQFQRALDEKRFPDAYAMLTPGLQGMMSLERFIEIETHTRQKIGTRFTRGTSRLTWYKDPANAVGPGIYAAFDIECEAEKTATCKETVILHQPPGQRFRVLRQERDLGAPR